MSISSQSATGFEPQTARPDALSPTRPFYWSVRRELWEHRAIILRRWSWPGLCCSAS